MGVALRLRDTGGGGALSQDAGHNGSFYRYAVWPSKNEQFSSPKKQY